MDIFGKCYEFTQVKEAVEAGIYPYFHALQSGQDTVVNMEGRRTIMIGSNNYLGLTSDPRVKEAAIKAIEKYGSGCSGSRFLNGTLDLHLKLENALAEFLHKDACITFSTGFQSNLGIISAIAGRNDVILCDKENHASIYDACRLSYAAMIRYKHSDMDDLEKALRDIPESKGILIVTDGVFSMGGEICKLPQIVELAKKYGARVMVDDAHGLGVLGENGRGTAEHFGLEDEVDILMGTFSKSLASLGGYMAASAEVISYVKHTSRPFIFSASIPPANAAAALCALDILKKEPQRVRNLNEIADYMRGLLRERNIPLNETETPIIPIMTYDDTRTFILCRELLNEGVYVNPVISPAVPQGYSMIRTSYTATHTKELMDEAADIFAKVFSKF
ncbi:MAG TPA: aminotransferase class I/II-fold pyridoxal phosphate-dependent enzyme [Clostridiaceae bacterium]|jgi:8-amino-7-oxononanoate synthase|nr:aminotransferase class I/II-fold pyridoxal phosphate-dependent enzyme [Clostridiaceae bacterium]